MYIINSTIYGIDQHEKRMIQLIQITTLQLQQTRCYTGKEYIRIVEENLRNTKIDFRVNLLLEMLYPIPSNYNIPTSLNTPKTRSMAQCGSLPTSFGPEQQRLIHDTLLIVLHNRVLPICRRRSEYPHTTL